MPEDTGTDQNQSYKSNASEAPGDPVPGSDEWMARMIRAICRQIDQIRSDLGDLRRQRSPDALLTKEEVAERLSVSERLVDTLIADGEIASVKIRRCRRVPKRALDAYIRSNASEEGGA